MDFNIMGSVDAITTTILIIVVLGLVGVITFWAWQAMQYKIFIIIRQVIKGRQIIKYDKARVIRDKDRNVWLKLRKANIKLPEPPPQSIEITEKGKKFLELFELEDSGYFPSESIKGYLSIQTKLDEKGFYHNKVAGMEPLTTQERALYIHELKESEDYKKDSKSELIAKAIPYIALVMIITVFLLFFNEAASPIIEVGESYKTSMGQFDKVVQRIEQLVDDKQTLYDQNDIINQSNIPN